MELNIDWNKAIEINRTALTHIVAEIFALLELALAGKVSHLLHMLHRKTLRILRPTESALRRLIVIMAQDVKVTLRVPRPMPTGLRFSNAGTKPTAFALFDARKRFRKNAVTKTDATGGPRILVFGSGPLIPTPQKQTKSATPSANLTAASLCRRFAALKLALETLPQQAKRLARWRLRRKLMKNPKFTSPLRPGPPPGHQRRPLLAVDHVLSACHGLAFDARAQPPS